jgi:hypothetical protein
MNTVTEIEGKFFVRSEFLGPLEVTKDGLFRVMTIQEVDHAVARFVNNGGLKALKKEIG